MAVIRKQNPIKPQPKPKCGKHLASMELNLETLRWECTTTGCHVVKYLEVDHSRPIIGKGSLVLLTYIHDKQARTFLRAEDNVMVDVTEFLDGMTTHPNGSATISLTFAKNAQTTLEG